MLKDMSAPALVSAIETGLQARWASRGRAPDSELHDGPDMMRVLTVAPFRALNGVVRTQLDPAEADAKIEETMAYFGSREVSWIWFVGPSTQPTDLGERLQAHGLAHAGDLPGMALGLDTLDQDIAMPPGLTIEHVEDEDTLRTLVHTSATGFGLPQSAERGFLAVHTGAGFGRDHGWRHYLALLNGEPVGAASIFLGDGLASIAAMATVPDARRQGIGSSLTFETLRHALDLGYRIGTLESSEMAMGTYRRTGFREYCKFAIYAFKSGKRDD